MTRRTGFRRRYGRDNEHGQMIVLFAITIVAIIAMAGLLIDGGMVWANRRQAQAAADTGALAAAKAIVGGAAGTTEGQTIAGLNGFGAGTDCSGNALANNGVTVNHPPVSGPHAGDSHFVEVITVRKMTTTFSGAIGLNCFMVEARAVASTGTNTVAKCSFCSINKSDKNHTLLMQSGATLRVDGDIYVNSTNGLDPTPKNDGKDFNGVTCTPVADSKGKMADHVCGDGFDLFGASPYISAQTISVVGGWEEQGDGGSSVVTADSLATVGGAPCPLHTEPINQVATANVCIGMPQIEDPLFDAANPKNIVPVPTIPGKPVAGVNGCPSGSTIPSGTSGSPANLAISSGTVTICPGAYFGGIKISGSASVTMISGIYYIAGGGFQVIGNASLNGGSGVMIYNSSGSASQDTDPGDDLIPGSTGKSKNIGATDITFSPGAPNVNQAVTMTFKFDGSGALVPTGTISFYDGSTPLTCASPPTITVRMAPNHYQAVCTYTWTTFGSKSITAVYSGDATYNPGGKNKNVTIAVPAGATIAPVNICTNHLIPACGSTTDGTVILHGPSNGPYSGLTIFQDRSSLLTVTISPGAGAGACGVNFMTIGVPNGTAPAPCGGLGGLQGTIYAPGQSGQNGALVLVTASGLANLQVIAANIEVDNDANARFAYTPQFFANGGIRLVE